MGSAALFLLPTHIKQPNPSSSSSSSSSSFLLVSRRPRRSSSRSIVPVARLFGPAIFEASKLKVLFLGVDEEKHPGQLPRAYTLTHSDITSKLTLAVSDTINRAQLQGWYNKLQRDEVVAEWKKVQGRMSLHVHCHISGGHFLLDLVANLRYYIFSKELPVVLKAFVHGDGSLFNNHPELEEALVWVYFHSNLPEFNRVECWGPLREAASTAGRRRRRRTVAATCGPPSPEDPINTPPQEGGVVEWARPQRCKAECDCCFPPDSLIPWPHSPPRDDESRRPAVGQTQQ